MKKGIVVSWGDNITRSSSIADALGYEDCHLRVLGFAKNRRLLGYISRCIRMFLLLYKKKPDILVVVSPPVFGLYVALFYRFFFASKVKVIGDFHNGVLRKEWKYWPFLKTVVRRLDCVLSHNDVVKLRIDYFFKVDSVVLGDPLLDVSNSGFSGSSDFLDDKRLNVLIPVSYAKDEPIAEILRAATSLSESVNFIMTGNYLKMFSAEEAESANVTFTGYISKEEYFSLLKGSDLVLCLTDNDDIQMCALIECLSYGKSFICSKNEVNLKLFEQWAVCLIDNFSEDIMEAVRFFYDNKKDSLGFKDNQVFQNDYMSSWRLVADDVFK